MSGVSGRYELCFRVLRSMRGVAVREGCPQDPEVGRARKPGEGDPGAYRLCLWHDRAIKHTTHNGPKHTHPWNPECNYCAARGTTPSARGSEPRGARLRLLRRRGVCLRRRRRRKSRRALALTVTFYVSSYRSKFDFGLAVQAWLLLAC